MNKQRYRAAFSQLFGGAKYLFNLIYVYLGQIYVGRYHMFESNLKSSFWSASGVRNI